MAYVLDRKVVKDTKEFNDYAYGITLPIQRGNTGYFKNLKKGKCGCNKCGGK